MATRYKRRARSGMAVVVSTSATSSAERKVVSGLSRGAFTFTPMAGLLGMSSSSHASLRALRTRLKMFFSVWVRRVWVLPPLLVVLARSSRSHSRRSRGRSSTSGMAAMAVPTT